MGTFVDLTGKRFGNWKVLSFCGTREVGNKRVKKSFWLCECQCEKKTLREIPTDSLKSGNSKSCGCYRKQITIERNTKHGFSRRGENGTSIYHVWRSMKDRCLNPNNAQYVNYGGRGIKICKAWEQSFISFKDWAFANGYHVGLTIDRINNDGNYEPSNCRWVDYYVQANNSRQCRFVTINGQTHTLKQWCKLLEVPYSTVMNRMQRNKKLSYEDALLIPKYSKSHLKGSENESM